MEVVVILSPEEIREITGKVRPSAQARALAAMGIESKSRPDNTLVVLRAHAEQVLSGMREPARQRKQPFRFYKEDGTSTPA